MDTEMTSWSQLKLIKETSTSQWLTNPRTRLSQKRNTGHKHLSETWGKTSVDIFRR